MLSASRSHAHSVLFRSGSHLSRLAPRLSKPNELPTFLFPLTKVDFHSQNLVQSPQRSFQQKSLFGFEFSPIPLREEAKQNKTVTEKVKDVKDDENQSKVEKAVQVQKEINEETLDLPTPPKTEKKTIWQKIKHELHHYWVGTKLLAVDFKISARLVKQVLQGKELTRRERRQLLRTTSDLFRLIPFAVIIVIPFAEFALPFIIKFFPNFLPSTYEDNFSKEEKKKKILQARLETARFFQDTIKEMALVAKDPKSAKMSEAFETFFKKIRMTGQQASNKDIILFSKFFKDELTIDNLSRPLIVSMCKYMNINAFGTTPFLRYQLRKKLIKLKEDDLVIQKEGGVSTLDNAELQQACQTRGMRTLGVPKRRLQNDLQQWIDLRLTEGIPATLLILSRALMLQGGVISTSDEDVSSALQAALSSLPDEVVKEVQLDVAEIEGSVHNESKLKVIKEQEDLIHEEAEEEKKTAETLVDKSKKDDTSVPEEEKKSEEETIREHIIDLNEAVSMLSSSSIVVEEKKDLEEIKQEMKEYAEDLDDLKQEKVTVSPASTMLNKRLEKMILKIESEIEKVDKEVGSTHHSILPDQKGEISISDLEKALETLKGRPKNPAIIKRILDDLDFNKDGKISVEELNQYADQLEDIEGVGVVKEEKENQK